MVSTQINLTINVAAIRGAGDNEHQHYRFTNPIDARSHGVARCCR
jgi:hypothetical protein